MKVTVFKILEIREYFCGFMQFNNKIHMKHLLFLVFLMYEDLPFASSALTLDFTVKLNSVD